jgi:hypothetical protein
MDFKKRIIVSFIMCLCLNGAMAQFNENLEKEILALSKKYTLDGIPRDQALGRLLDISNELPDSLIDAHLTGQFWKYSHSVSAYARQFRTSNGIYVYDFSADGNAYFIKQNETAKTWCTWEYNPEKQLNFVHFENQERKKSTRVDYMTIHSITADRLVLASLVKSTKFPDKSEVLFRVYFRR